MTSGPERPGLERTPTPASGEGVTPVEQDRVIVEQEVTIE